MREGWEWMVWELGVRKGESVGWEWGVRIGVRVGCERGENGSESGMWKRVENGEWEWVWERGGIERCERLRYESEILEWVEMVERKWYERKWGVIMGCNGKEVGVRNSGGRLKVRE